MTNDFGQEEETNFFRFGNKTFIMKSKRSRATPDGLAGKLLAFNGIAGHRQ